VAALQSVLDQYAHAMLYIGQGYALQEKAEILSITQGPLCKARDLWQGAKASSGPAAETVIARAPQWGTDHAMPHSWTFPGVSVTLHELILPKITPPPAATTSD
jgi:hypothetical protein